VRQIEHPSFLSSFPGKTLQASFSTEGLRTAPGPGTFIIGYRQVPQWNVTCTPEQISESSLIFDYSISLNIKIVKSYWRFISGQFLRTV
jgi:hypothetical protein